MFHLTLKYISPRPNYGYKGSLTTTGCGLIGGVFQKLRDKLQASAKTSIRAGAMGRRPNFATNVLM